MRVTMARISFGFLGTCVAFTVTLVRRMHHDYLTMQLFPTSDPIPLPAPVWLFKILHIVTLSLHFMAVWMFLGGLAFAIIWSLLGRGRKDGRYADASAALAKRLPIVMTFVINFG